MTLFVTGSRADADRQPVGEPTQEGGGPPQGHDRVPSAGRQQQQQERGGRRRERQRLKGKQQALQRTRQGPNSIDRF